MIIIFDNQNRTQSEFVVDWLNVASENAQSAVLLSGNPSLKKQALVHVQQSAETVTKALALGTGMPYEAVKKSGHHNPGLFCDVLKDMIRKTHLEPVLDSMIQGDSANAALRAIGAMLRATNRQHMATGGFEFQDDVQRASPSDVKEALELIDKISSQLGHFAPSLIENLATEVPDLFNVSEWGRDNQESIIPTGAIRWMERQGKDVDALKDWLELVLGRDFDLSKMDDSGEGTDSGDIGSVPTETDIKEIIAYLELIVTKLPVTIIKLFIIGALAWPHHTSARYPEPSDSTRLGAQRYNDEIGVIRYIQELSQIILEVVGDINNYYQERS